jgi:mono/diheme cytochrome c family protein
MSRLVKRTIWIIGGIAGFGVVLLLGAIVYINVLWDRSYDRPVTAMKASLEPAAIARGEYLFKNTFTCWECHSPERDARVAPSGGKAFDLRNVGPGFGIFYSRNITPDPETGIGAWSDGAIVRSLREGLRPDGTLLFPIMPVEALNGMSDEDALAIVSYLRSIPPVRSPQKTSELSQFAKALYAFGVLKPQPAITEVVPTPAKGITAAYGRYLANHASACSDCHTPRNLQDGSFFRDSLFAGGSIELGLDEPGIEVLAYARNITPDKETGIGTWTEEQFLDAVRVGMRPDGTVLALHMPYSSYGLMAEDDLKAIFVYLKTVTPIRKSAPEPRFLETYRNGTGVDRGKVIFENSCMICHGQAAKGAAPTNVVLAEIAPSFDDKMLADFIAGGNVGLRMPAFGKTLSPEQIRDVIAYIRMVQKDPG